MRTFSESLLAIRPLSLLALAHLLAKCPSKLCLHHLSLERVISANCQPCEALLLWRLYRERRPLLLKLGPCRRYPVLFLLMKAVDDLLPQLLPVTLLLLM
jgi:uncharacterized membrane protein YhfC